MPTLYILIVIKIIKASWQSILLNCIDFSNIRSKYYSLNSLNELFNTVKPLDIFKFLKEIGLQSILHVFTKGCVTVMGAFSLVGFNLIVGGGHKK